MQRGWNTVLGCVAGLGITFGALAEPSATPEKLATEQRLPELSVPGAVAPEPLQFSSEIPPPPPFDPNYTPPSASLKEKQR